MTERKMCKFYNLNLPDRSISSIEPAVDVPADDDETVEETIPPPLPVAPNEHKLQHSYCLWYSRRPPPGARNNTTQGYGQALRLAGRCSTVEQWWGMYSHLRRPHDLPPLTDLSLFKHGIKPMWEDPANINGGKWVVRLKKGLASGAWESLCMAMLGEQFLVGNELCGAVVSVRFQDDQLALWHRNASDQFAVTRIRDTLKRILHLPSTTLLEYKVHSDCLRASATIERRTSENNGNSSSSTS